METFTLWKEIHLQLESPDITRQPFTMETFTLWSHPPMSGSYSMEAQSPKGGQHLQLETFTLCPHTMEFSDFIPTQVGLMISTATVSPPEYRVDSWIIANPPARYFISSQLCDSQPHSSPTPKPRQQMILRGFSSKGLNKLAHALNGNHVHWQIPVPHYRSKEWKNSFTLPNGMIVYNYAFYGKNKLWLKYYRRGLA